MRTLLFILFMSILTFFSTQVYADTSDDFGIVMDISGDLQVKRGNKTVPAEIGLNLMKGDVIDIMKDGSLVVVSYSECYEWQLTGPDTLSITDDGMVLKSDKTVPERQLPVCYSLSEFDSGKSDVAGGIILRGIPEDPLSHLREEFKKGKASNSTLITIIMHDLKNGKIKKAEPYFETLRERLPNSKIVKALSEKF